jgi:hypothetical protein
MIKFGANYLRGGHQTSIQGQMPYADATVTGWDNLKYEVTQASSYFTTSNLFAPTKRYFSRS